MAGRVRHKEFRFPVEIGWDGGRRTTAYVAGKPLLGIATPPEFRGSDPGVWSPEDAFVAAAGSCLAVTIAALAERDHLELQDLSVRAEGVVGRRPDGAFGFIRIEQTVVADVASADERAVAALVAEAEDTCLVTVSLDLPVETHVEIRPCAPLV
jgi:organic hydroperoxide reductase OsmC/OhrA